MKTTSRNNRRGNNGGFKITNILKILALAFVIIGITVGGAMGGFVLSVLKEAPSINPKDFRSILTETSVIYDNNNEILEKLVKDEFSEYVTLDKIPKTLQDAVISIEDERFYEHDGVDFKRVFGALIHDIRTRSFAQGASTISMQLAKNLYTSSGKDVTRKLKDVYYAFQLEKDLSKEQVLEAYLNSASFGRGSVGVQAAARSFFDKDVSQLNLAESALIAGITKAPSAYSPFNMVPISDEEDVRGLEVKLLASTEGVREVSAEDHKVYENLLEHGKIDKYDYQQLETGRMYVQKAEFNPTSKERQQVVLKKMKDLGHITESDYTAALEAPIEIKLDEKSFKGISSYYVDAVKEEALQILKDLGHTPEEAEKLLYNGGLQIKTSLDMEMQKNLEETVSNRRYYPGTFTDANGILQPQVGSVIIDNETGEVKAIVGGRGIGGNNILNRAKVPRQPGSSIKPISVYLSYLNNGGTAGDVYNDVVLRKSKQTPYDPKNITGYQGWTTVRRLVIKSSNVGAYLVGRKVGSDDDDSIFKMIDTLKELGVSTIVTPEQSTHNDANFSAMSLGGMTYGISPLEMAGGFQALANQGKFIKPTFISEIVSNVGSTIYTANREGKQVTTPQVAYILTSMLQDVVSKGTGTYANLPRMHEAGKTGTTNDKKDSWFVGYTPYYTASVWIGNDKPTPLADHSRMAARLWRAIMTDVHDGLPDKNFEMPDDIYKKYVPVLGYTELYAKGTTPKNQNKLYNRVPKKTTTSDSKDDKDSKDSKDTKDTKSTDSKSKETTSKKSKNNNDD